MKAAGVEAERNSPIMHKQRTTMGMVGRGVEYAGVERGGTSWGTSGGSSGGRLLGLASLPPMRIRLAGESMGDLSPP
jgi:hypothetical protein